VGDEVLELGDYELNFVLIHSLTVPMDNMLHFAHPSACAMSCFLLYAVCVGWFLRRQASANSSACCMRRLMGAMALLE
jgi:hypothetical protein